MSKPATAIGTLLYRHIPDPNLESLDCWRWVGAKHGFGYGMVYDTRVRRGTPAHRASYEVHVGSIPQGLSVLHECDNPECCNPWHLFIGTTADNLADMRAKGRHNLTSRARGSAHRCAKFSEAEVLQIRERLKAGESPTDIARELGVWDTLIFKIRDRHTWAHI